MSRVIPLRFTPEQISPFSGKEVGYFRKGTPAVPSKTKEGKEYRAQGVDLGEFFRWDGCRVGETIPINATANAVMEHLYGKRMIEIGRVKAEMVLVPRIKFFFPSDRWEYCFDAINTQSRSVVTGGIPKFTTTLTCNGLAVQSRYDPVSKVRTRPENEPCLAYAEGLVDSKTGEPYTNCSKCKPSMSLYIRTHVGIIKVVSHSGNDIKTMYNFFLRGDGKRFESVLGKIPFVLTRKLRDCQERRPKEGGGFETVMSKKWFLDVAVDEEFQIKAHAAEERLAIAAVTQTMYGVNAQSVGLLTDGTQVEDEDYERDLDLAVTAPPQKAEQPRQKEPPKALAVFNPDNDLRAQVEDMKAWVEDHRSGFNKTDMEGLKIWHAAFMAHAAVDSSKPPSPNGMIEEIEAALGFLEK